MSPREKEGERDTAADTPLLFSGENPTLGTNSCICVHPAGRRVACVRSVASAAMQTPLLKAPFKDLYTQYELEGASRVLAWQF